MRDHSASFNTNLATNLYNMMHIYMYIIILFITFIRNFGPYIVYTVFEHNVVHAYIYIFEY